MVPVHHLGGWCLWRYQARLRIFAGATTLIFGYGAYLTAAQYIAMRADPLARLLLPPYQDLSYFLIAVVLARIFGPYFISFLMSLLFLLVATRYNKKYDERFFEKEEIILGALSIFLVGHPGWLFYFVGLIALYMSIQLYSRFILRKVAYRLPLYNLWVPIAIFVILISKYWLAGTNFWLLLAL